ncbi:MAG: hypothetical protein HKN87_08355 [Saprospiraceae bacterium]|nr:hypothetical protein [Saprospiraceae bacterium]
MKLVQRLIDYLRNKAASDINKDVPDGLCPNCWGRNEYGGKFFEALKTHGIDVNSKDPSIGWIQDYANKHLAAIELKREDDNLVCQKCKLTYHVK